MQLKDIKYNQGSKRNKFESFQNLKDNKFSAYKYERNIFIGKSNENNNDDYEYIESEQPKQKRIKNISEIDIKRQIPTKQQEVDNLWQLWDKLGQQQQTKVFEQKDIQNKDENQLTEDQLLQCFGQQQCQDKQNDDVQIDKKPFQHEKINYVEDDKKQDKKNQAQAINEDKDLMDIWGQEQTQNINVENINQLNVKNKDYNSKNLQVNQYYEWQDQKQTKNHQSQLNHFQHNKNINIHDKQDDFQMQLQDPNKINLKYKNNTSQEQDKPSTSIYTKDESTSKPSKPTISNNNKNTQINKNTTSKLTQNQSTHISHKNKENQTLSIINEIFLQNNTKTMTKLIPGKHYQVFDTKKFVLHPFKQNTYSYFGIEAKDHSLLQPTHKIDSKDHTLYLYSFQTKQAFLQLKPQPFDKSYIDFLSVKRTVTISPEKKQIKKVMEYKTDLCYKIRVCSTKQHIATLFYKTIKDGYLYDLRLFDQYEHVHSQPIALIEVKDGYVNECCYCDTNVFLEKGYLKDHQRAFFSQRVKFQIQQFFFIDRKLRMILNLKNGKLTANMGIGGIDSSPFNCCLQNQQNQKFIYLMGLLLQNNSQQIHFVNTQQDYQNKDIQNEEHHRKKHSFIIKVGQGVSPLLGLAIAAGRKIYIDSFQ